MFRKILGGRYEIISHLGGGGFGTTFVAVDKHLPGNPQCVVKHLKPKNTDNQLALQAARRLFNREAEALYQLGNHPQIPRLFAHFEEEREFYLVQEFVEGHELKQELRPAQQLSEAQTIAMLREVLEVLTFVHQQDAIHRDIKPSNLIRRRQDGKLVLIDFGAVKQIGTQVVTSQGQTSFTIAIGSPGYMPSEQLAGRPRFCSDIYAVGMLGIQALTGLYPTELPEDRNTCEIIWRDRVQVSPELGDVLDKMVRYDFRDRYQSVEQVLEALNFDPARLATSTIVLPANCEISSMETDLVIPVELHSERGVTYKRLQNLLAKGKWKEADRETKKGMLAAAGREKEGWLRAEDLEKFPCQDLATIDHLWVKYSNGHFGFSTQQRIWQSVGGKPDANYKTARRFGDRVGWYQKDDWLFYHNLTFNLNAPLGHLPVCDLRGGGRQVWGPMWICLFCRIEACELHKPTPASLDVESEIPTIDCSSEQEVDYTCLQRLLAAGQWKEADRETTAIVLKLAGREKESRLEVKDIEKISTQDLRNIDNLWVRYSNGRFGFSVQKHIWQEVGGKLGAYNSRVYHKFAERVGWRERGKWKHYSDLTFSLNAPPGHLPVKEPIGVGPFAGIWSGWLLSFILSRRDL